ncbi:2-amino-4-hydroxy-6-hydroxymethyldihydropteridine diphosphokinase [Ectothiorhodospiraceae bacterium BW-2]|nr:2-amino-4-hydroxy-6-hydroxymethyldihydropteridine diphosphokinase [Ectothiorhodospiraceae bacterium BW-2]
MNGVAVAVGAGRGEPSPHHNAARPRVVTVYIGLGSNLQQPLQQIERALKALSQLPQTRLKAVSNRYRSAPLGNMAQPDYLNAVAKLETLLEPQPLLQQLQQLERQQGRQPSCERWQARTLDLDLLLYGNLEQQQPQLTLPHPGLTERPFVAIPLLELDPDLTLPNGVRLDHYPAAAKQSELLLCQD